MVRPNDDIRELARKSGVCLWQIADVLGVHEVTFTRKLRYPLASGFRANVIEIIKEICHGQNEDN